MKVVFLISVVALAAVLNGCTPTKSVAGVYKEAMKSGSGDAAPEGEPSPDGDNGDPVDGDPGDPEVVEGDPEVEGDTETASGGAGDAAKGKALMDESACASCHDTPIAKTVKLDATAVARLDKAKTGTNSSYHKDLPAYKAENRADLEAALKAVK